MKLRLIILSFLQFAVWGCYLTSMGAYLSKIGLGTEIGTFYAMQGIVSLFMPAIMGMVADRWMQAQRLFSLCHLLSACFMGAAAYVGLSAGETAVDGTLLFLCYTLSVAFYMPTLALSYSVSYTALDVAGLDHVKTFPPIRVFGTIGFLCAMWFMDFSGFQNTAMQFAGSALCGVLISAYALTMPPCATAGKRKGTSLVEMLGLQAFSLFRDRTMATFFIFSFLLGVSLQITNGFGNAYIQSFGALEEYKGLFFVEHSNLLISISQVSETLCILLIPFCMKRFGIKKVILIAMLAWVCRFAFFGLGDPGSGVWLLILSCIVYGIAFDFFNISGSLYINQSTDLSIRSSAQGVLVMMTNGFGSTIGSLMAGLVFNRLVFAPGLTLAEQSQGWHTAWYIFAAYALVVAIAFAAIFKEVKSEE